MLDQAFSWSGMCFFIMPQTVNLTGAAVTDVVNSTTTYAICAMSFLKSQANTQPKTVLSNHPSKSYIIVHLPVLLLSEYSYTPQLSFLYLF